MGPACCRGELKVKTDQSLRKENKFKGSDVQSELWQELLGEGSGLPVVNFGSCSANHCRADTVDMEILQEQPIALYDQVSFWM